MSLQGGQQCGPFSSFYSWGEGEGGGGHNGVYKPQLWKINLREPPFPSFIPHSDTRGCPRGGGCWPTWPGPGSPTSSPLLGHPQLINIPLHPCHGTTQCCTVQHSPTPGHTITHSRSSHSCGKQILDHDKTIIGYFGILFKTNESRYLCLVDEICQNKFLPTCAQSFQVTSISKSEYCSDQCSKEI